MVQLQRLAIAPHQIQNLHVNLTPEQQHYLGRVLRLQQGDRFIVLDGQGQGWMAQLRVDLPDEPPQAELLEPITIQTELPIELTLITALPKGSGFDEIVRSCTELGVSQFRPVISQRTLLQPSPQKLIRWQRIATEATEQCERQVIPTVFEPVAFLSCLSTFKTVAAQRYLCVARGDSLPLQQCLKLQSHGSDGVIVATGPEGGWTEAEVEAAIASGFQPVSLGRRILRAVTAPLVAATLVLAHFELSE